MADLSTGPRALAKVIVWVFAVLLIGAAACYVVFTFTPPADVQVRQAISDIFLLLLIGAGVAYDVEAFLSGATATISQSLLAIYRAHRGIAWAWAIGAGVLLGHLTLAHEPGQYPYGDLLKLLVDLLPLVALGMWIGMRFLYQRPNVD